MPWNSQWSGNGVVTASEVQVINGQTVVASINQQGVITGQSLFIAGDITFQGGSLTQILNLIPHGIIAKMMIPSADLPTSSFGATESGLFELDVVLSPGRSYSIALTNMVYQASAALCRAAVWVRYTTDGTTPTTSSNQLFEVWKNTESADGVFDIIPDHSVDISVNSQLTLRMLVTSANQIMTGGSQQTHKFIAAGTGIGNVGARMDVVDNGPLIPNTGIYVGGSGGGGTPTPVFKSFFTLATDSQSFQQSGAPSNGSGTFPAEYMYFGQDPSYAPNGNWASFAWFNTADGGSGQGGTNGLGSIADMSGVSAANVSFLYLWVYTSWWFYIAGGTLYIGHGNTPPTHGTEPGSLGIREIAVGYTARGQGRWTNLLGTPLGTAILGGTFNCIVLGPGPTTDLQYYGYAAGAGFGSNQPAIWGGYYK